MKTSTGEAGPVPVAATERLPSVDALRGLALLGVAAVNACLVLGPQARFFSVPWRSTGSAATLLALHLLFAGKAYSLLALLFGAGLVLFERQLGPRSAGLQARRLAALAFLGITHGLGIWSGDVLTVYATVGFLWLIFLRDRPGAVRGSLSAYLLAALPVALLAMGAAIALAGAITPALLDSLRAGAVREEAAVLARAEAVYRSGSWWEILLFRARSFLESFLAAIGYSPQILGLFLAGGWAVERGLFEHPEENRLLLRRLAAFGIGIGLPGELVYVALGSRGTERVVAAHLAEGIHAASAPALAIGLGATLLLFWSEGRARFLLALAPLGRLSLSAYLAQTVLFTGIAHGIGFNLYGKLTLETCLGLGIAAWAAEVVLSHLYLSRFRSGPVERVVRFLVYGA